MSNILLSDAHLTHLQIYFTCFMQYVVTLHIVGDHKVVVIHLTEYAITCSLDCELHSGKQLGIVIQCDVLGTTCTLESQ